MSVLVKLYKAKSWKAPHNIQIRVSGYSDTFDLTLVGNYQKPDCCIGHFGYNIYFRTPKGMKAQKYVSLHSMYKAIKIVAKNLGLTIESLGIKRGWKYRAVISN